MRSAVKMLVTLVTVLLLVFVAGCIPAPAEITPAPAPTPEPTPTPQPTPIPTGEKVNFRFLISDEENAIGDFEQLWVHITSIGVQKGGDSGNWTEFTPDITKVDLKLLVGENATEIWSGYVEPGEYNKVFIHVDNVTGILDGAYGGGTANVTLPSDKLQISKPFTLSPDLTVNFVFDITVVEAGKSGKYILKPQIGQSGHDKPFNLVTAHGKPEDTGKPEGVDTTPPVISLTGVDTTPPVINVTGVDDGEQYSEPVTPVISVSDETDPNPSVVSATLNGEPFTSGTVVSGPGVYELEVTAIDASGNEAEVVVNFEIVEAEDTTPPVIDVTGVDDGEQYSEPVTPVISVSDETDPNPSVVSATLNGEPFTSGTEVSEPGVYELEVTAIDASGNEAEVVVNFEIVPE